MDGKRQNHCDYSLYFLLAINLLLCVVETEESAQKGSLYSFAEDLVRTLSENYAVKKVIDAGMNAVKTAAVDEGVEILKKDDKAKRFVKTGLDILKAVDSYASLSTEEDEPEELKCHFQCPVNERVIQGRPFRNLEHAPSANGCGSYGFRFHDDAFPDLTNCCNIHDRCYDECGNVKSDCDKQFQRCLERVCSGQTPSTSSSSSDNCDVIKDGLYLAVVNFGCDAFLSAQKNACVCV